MLLYLVLSAIVVGLIPKASGHAALFHTSMYGFNVTQQTFPYDNRPVAPLQNYTFDQWWFHGHLDYPPNEGDYFELPAGGVATAEISCDKGATSFFASAPGGDIQNGNDVCPGSPPSEYHTTGPDDLKGCSLAIAYKPNVSEVQPEDFVVFSINQTCVWNRFTDFQVPAAMPPCPPGGCHCAFFWIHSADSGGEQNYMNGFKCNITGSTSNVALATPQVARRCGADPDNGKPDPAPGNCTYGAKAPFYWFQAERNNMFEGTYSPPYYLDLYNFKDGAQDDIFADSYPDGIPVPGPNQTAIPTPVLYTPGIAAATPVSAATPNSSIASSLSVSSLLVTTPGVSASTPTSTPLGSSSATSSSGNFSGSSDALSPPESVSVSIIVSTLFVTVTAAPIASTIPGAASASSIVSNQSSTPTPSSAVPGASSLPSSAIFSSQASGSETSSAPFFPTVVSPFASQPVTIPLSSAPAPTDVSSVSTAAALSSSISASSSQSSSVTSSAINSFAPSAVSSSFSTLPATPSSTPFFPTAVPSFASQIIAPSPSSSSLSASNSSNLAPPAGEFTSAITTILLNQPTASAAASSPSGSINDTVPTSTPAVDAFFQIHTDAAASSGFTDTAAPTCSSSIAKRSLRSRMFEERKSFLTLRNHRRLRDRSQLWHIF